MCRPIGLSSFAKQFLCELLIHDGDLRRVEFILVREIASAEDRNFHSAEESWRHELHVAVIGAFICPRCVTLNRHPAVPFVAVQQRHHREADICGAGNRPQSIQKTAVVRADLRYFSAVQRRLHLHGHQICRFETGIECRAGFSRLWNEKTGADEQGGATTDATCAITNPLRSRTAVPPATLEGLVLQSRGKVGPRGLQRREQSEERFRSTIETSAVKPRTYQSGEAESVIGVRSAGRNEISVRSIRMPSPSPTTPPAKESKTLSASN